MRATYAELQQTGVRGEAARGRVVERRGHRRSACAHRRRRSGYHEQCQGRASAPLAARRCSAHAGRVRADAAVAGRARQASAIMDSLLSAVDEEKCIVFSQFNNVLAIVSESLQARRRAAREGTARPWHP